MSKAKTYNPNNLIQKVFWSFSIVVILLASMYMYFVSSSIVNVVLRKEIETDIVKLHSGVGELESQYLTLENNITMDRALSMGFVKLSNKKFVTRTSQSLSINR